MSNYSEFKWNSALEDLMLLSSLEKTAIEYNISNNVVMYFKLLKAYFQKLCSMVEFDRETYIKRFEILKEKIFSVDQNGDGKIDEWEEMGNAVTLGKAMEELEQLYYELTDIKVTCGLSVQKTQLTTAKQILKEKEIKRYAPVLDLK